MEYRNVHEKWIKPLARRELRGKRMPYRQILPAAERDRQLAMTRDRGAA